MGTKSMIKSFLLILIFISIFTTEAQIGRPSRVAPRRPASPPSSAPTPSSRTPRSFSDSSRFNSGITLKLQRVTSSPSTEESPTFSYELKLSNVLQSSIDTLYLVEGQCDSSTTNADSVGNQNVFISTSRSRGQISEPGPASVRGHVAYEGHAAFHSDTGFLSVWTTYPFSFLLQIMPKSFWSLACLMVPICFVAG